MKKLLLFALEFAILLAGLAFIYPRVYPSYQGCVIPFANPFLRTLEPAIELEGKSDGNLVIYARYSGGERKRASFADYHPHVFYLSLVLLPALLLATPAPIVSRLRMLALAVPLLFVSHVVSLVGTFATQPWIARGPHQFLNSWIWGLCMTSGQLVAVAGWFLLGGSYWFPEWRWAPVGRDDGKHRRNEPCPCGSGKKYKLCCGR